MSFQSSPLNCVLIAGRVGNAGTLRKSAQGADYLTFSISFPQLQRNYQTGEVEWCYGFIDCIMYGSKASGYSGELFKGRAVSVQGRLFWDRYIDSRKVDKSKLQLRVDRVCFDDDPAGGDDGGN